MWIFFFFFSSSSTCKTKWPLIAFCDVQWRSLQSVTFVRSATPTNARVNFVSHTNKHDCLATKAFDLGSAILIKNKNRVVRDATKKAQNRERVLVRGCRTSAASGCVLIGASIVATSAATWHIVSHDLPVPGTTPAAFRWHSHEQLACVDFVKVLAEARQEICEAVTLER